MTPIELWDAALTLENDGEFYKQHGAYKTSSPIIARDIIASSMNRLRIAGGRLNEDLEQLRRYLDDTWEIKRNPGELKDDRYSKIPTIEFWKDEVRYPTKVAAPKAPAGYQGPTIGSTYTPAQPNPSRTYVRHGQLWTIAEHATLDNLWWQGCAFSRICETMERPPAGVLSKLVEHKLLNYDNVNHKYTVLRPPTLTTNMANADFASITNSITQLNKETNMNINGPVTLVTKIFIDATGTDVDTLTNPQIYDLIASQEAAIKKLEVIENKPKRLQKEIEARKAGIAALVAHLDKKESTTEKA
jgi:hypothetical protein